MFIKFDISEISIHSNVVWALKYPWRGRSTPQQNQSECVDCFVFASFFNNHKIFLNENRFHQMAREKTSAGHFVFEIEFLLKTSQITLINRCEQRDTSHSKTCLPNATNQTSTEALVDKRFLIYKKLLYFFTIKLLLLSEQNYVTFCSATSKNGVACLIWHIKRTKQI